MELGSRECHDSLSHEAIRGLLRRSLSQAHNPPPNLRMTERDTARLTTRFTSILEAVTAEKGSKLPLEQRLTLYARYHEGAQTAEIAKAMKCDRATVKRRVVAGEDAIIDYLDSHATV